MISFVVTAKLICLFVFAYAKSRFSHDAAQIMLLTKQPLVCFCLFGLRLYIPVKKFSHVGMFPWVEPVVSSKQ